LVVLPWRLREIRGTGLVLTGWTRHHGRTRAMMADCSRHVTAT
jgi:hypothetical protein